MEKETIDLESLKSRILVIAPNVNDSIVAAAIIIQVIDRLNVSVIFTNNNKLDELRLDPGIEKIYLVGIGPQNCETVRLKRFLKIYHDKICFWANNHEGLEDDLIITVKRCPNLDEVILGKKSSVARFLIDALKIKNIPPEWETLIDSLANRPSFPNLLANRFRTAIYTAEVMEQYDSRSVTAETRQKLLSELLLPGDTKAITEMTELSFKIEREKQAAIDRIIELAPGCGLIAQKRQLFNRNEVFGYFLAQLKVLVIQYKNMQGEMMTEVCANKKHKRKLDRIACTMEANDLKTYSVKSKLTIPGDWEKVKSLIAAELG